MRFKDFYNLYTEGSKSKPTIVVDVQPTYSGIFDGDENPIFEDIIRFVNNQSGPVLMFVNAESDGLTSDTVDDIKIYWEDSGFSRPWSDVEIIDKGYGYIRSWIDLGVSESSIQKAIRIMYQNRISDSRGIVPDFDEEDSTNMWKKLLNDDSIPEDSISVEWISLKKLKSYSPAYLVGGGRNECLKEVELMMNAFNIKYTKINDLIY
jgi:hypothetical protein